MNTNWSRQEAIDLCFKLEQVAPNFGAHIALTGGLLYKSGDRKDCDILIYRIRQKNCIDFDGLWLAFALLGLVKVKGWGWCYKCTYKEKQVDIFDPEEYIVSDGTPSQTSEDVVEEEND